MSYTMQSTRQYELDHTDQEFICREKPTVDHEEGIGDLVGRASYQVYQSAGIYIFWLFTARHGIAMATSW